MRDGRRITEKSEMSSLSVTRGTPWYREPWPWFLMAGPAIVVVAGIVTAWLAVTHEDGLVAADYYKRGLAINRTIEKEEKAARLGMSAQLGFSDDGKTLRVFVAGKAALAPRLALRLVHATRTELDQSLALERATGGWYEAELTPPVSGKWTLLLEDPEGGWRLTGTWVATVEQRVVTLTPTAP
jgi:hypothetical protein